MAWDPRSNADKRHENQYKNNEIDVIPRYNKYSQVAVSNLPVAGCELAAILDDRLRFTAVPPSTVGGSAGGLMFCVTEDCRSDCLSSGCIIVVRRLDFFRFRGGGFLAGDSNISIIPGLSMSIPIAIVISARVRGV